MADVLTDVSLKTGDIFFSFSSQTDSPDDIDIDQDDSIVEEKRKEEDNGVISDNRTRQDDNAPRVAQVKSKLEIEANAEKAGFGVGEIIVVAVVGVVLILVVLAVMLLTKKRGRGLHKRLDTEPNLEGAVSESMETQESSFVNLMEREKDFNPVTLTSVTLIN